MPRVTRAPAVRAVLAPRRTIYVEDAEVLEHDALPARQYRLRLRAPKCAQAARPGSFAHLQCDSMLPMRRPMSILRADADAGWIEVLYKRVGFGTQRLTSRQPGEHLSVIGPIGVPFTPDPECTRPLLIGGGVGIPPMIFLAERLRREGGHWQPLVLMGSEIEFPFATTAAARTIEGIPPAARATLAVLEEQDIACRLASRAGFAGCYDNWVTELARAWLKALTDAQRKQVQVFACGPHPMLAATATLAREFRLPCQVSLEEYMACAVGGCAGCTVPIYQDGKITAMKRVCVDGPVFDALRVFP